VAIAVISGLALWLFHEGAYKGVNLLRCAGVILALSSVIAALLMPIGLPMSLACAALQLLLWAALGGYARIRVDVAT
jgi:hypothetical protein